MLALIDEKQGAGLGDRFVTLIEDMRAQGRSLIVALVSSMRSSLHSPRRMRTLGCLLSILGVGVLISSALIAAIGKAETFEHGRDLAAWLGLVPRQSTTGGKPKRLGISKRGNKYLRKLLIHGARAALRKRRLEAAGCMLLFVERILAPRPWHEFVDAVVRPSLGDLLHDVSDVGEGLDAVQLAAFDDGIDGGGALAAGP